MGFIVCLHLCIPLPTRTRPRRFRPRNPRRCQKCPVTGDGVVELLREGVINDPHHRPKIHGEGEGDADVRVGMHEIRGAVDGVEDECWGGGEGAGVGCFFAEEGVGRIFGAQVAEDEFFDGFVGFGDEVRGWRGISAVLFSGACI